MKLRDTINRALQNTAIPKAMERISRLSEVDRFQASLGIERAAQMVADWAYDAGLSGVTIERYPAEGAELWWGFAAPMAWTPVRACATLLMPNGTEVPAIDQATTPFSLATYSAPTDKRGSCYRIVVEGQNSPLGIDSVLVGVDHREIAGLNGRVAGFISATPARNDSDGLSRPGRIELDPRSPLFGFSVVPAVLQLLIDAAAAGAVLKVDIQIDRLTTMPVVSGLLPGTGEERWVLSHLCHPRPGANDNASGVVASLAVAETLARGQGWRTASSAPVRFLWGPEFLGTIAALYNRAHPSMVLNLDMVGEDQRLCASPFVVERVPDEYDTGINALAEECVSAVFQATMREADYWKAEQFLGFSDHSIFADSTVGRPAIQFCHPKDRFNHSGADTADKVSPLELLRSVASSVALLALLDNQHSDERMRVLQDWGDRELVAIEGVAKDAEREGHYEWAKRFRAYSIKRIESLGCIKRSSEISVADDLASVSAVPHRRWYGPLNLRAMLGNLSPDTKSLIGTRVSADKRTYAWILGVGLRINGRLSWPEIFEGVSFDARRPLDDALFGDIKSWYEESGWVR